MEQTHRPQMIARQQVGILQASTAIFVEYHPPRDKCFQSAFLDTYFACGTDSCVLGNISSRSIETPLALSRGQAGLCLSSREDGAWKEKSSGVLYPVHHGTVITRQYMLIHVMARRHLNTTASGRATCKRRSRQVAKDGQTHAGSWALLGLQPINCFVLCTIGQYLPVYNLGAGCCFVVEFSNR